MKKRPAPKELWRAVGSNPQTANELPTIGEHRCIKLSINISSESHRLRFLKRRYDVEL
ncbi:hypothetical protein HAX54_001071, partial [Datura stramonium]|nr:hypothetical protein [Datura stramonium]